MAISKKKYEGTDPGFYDREIKEQRKRIREDPGEAWQWLDLGRLHEAKIDLTNTLARHNPIIRYFNAVYLLTVSMVIAIGYYIFSSPFPYITPAHSIFTTVFIILITMLIGWTWSLRYPPSGWRYFKKAVSLDPHCEDAYIHLGVISLRRYRKHSACKYFEKATELNADNKKIERKLKTLYEKEFVSFFNKKTEKEIKLQNIIDHQLNEIKDLRSKVSSLENQIESLSDRADQAKWEVNHKTKLLTRKMNERLETIQNNHEKQIADIKRSFEVYEDTEDFAQKNFVRLTTEIMEAKAELQTSSFKEARNSVEALMGSDDWQSLLTQTQTYLATAEHTFRMLAEEKDTPDYSLIGMELCKALEAEINRTLVAPFLNYLKGNEREFLKVNQVGESKGKPRYFIYLGQVVDRLNYPEISTLTLGQYYFVLQRTIKGDYALRAYKKFLDRTCSSSEVKIGKKFLKQLETVTNRYRNAIAHESSMNKKECIHLRRLIFAEKESLLKICCRLANSRHVLRIDRMTDE